MLHLVHIFHNCDHFHSLDCFCICTRDCAFSGVLSARCYTEKATQARRRPGREGRNVRTATVNPNDRQPAPLLCQEPDSTAKSSNRSSHTFVSARCYTVKAQNSWHRRGTQKTGNTYNQPKHPSTDTTHRPSTKHYRRGSITPIRTAAVHAFSTVTTRHCRPYPTGSPPDPLS